MMALSRRLRHRISILSREETQDPATGALSEAWVDAGRSNIPAGVRVLSGRETLAAASVHAGVTSGITIRRRSDVSAGMRAVCNGISYDIKYLLPDAKLAEVFQLMCEEGVSDA
jgi:SPP1 family predicted phage head-tail adaptor